MNKELPKAEPNGLRFSSAMQTKVPTVPSSPQENSNSSIAALYPWLLALLGLVCGVLFPFLPVAGLLSYENPRTGRGSLTITADGFDAVLFDIWSPLTYVESGLREFWYVLALMVLSAFFSILRNYRAMLWLTFGACAASYAALQIMLNALLLKSQIMIYKVLPPMVANAYGPEVRPLWGWLVLLCGLILLFSSALIGLRQSSQIGPHLNRATVTNAVSSIAVKSKTRFSHRTPEILAVAGICGIYYFLLFPSVGAFPDVMHSIYMVRADSQKWGLLLLPPLAFFFMLRQDVKKGLLACGGLALMALIAVSLHLLKLAPPASAPDFVWSHYGTSSSLQWIALFSGILLLGMATVWARAREAGYFQAWSECLPASIYSKAPRAANGCCAVCGTTNPFEFTKCYKCFSPLPWVKGPKVKQAKAPRARRSGPGLISNFIGAIDWSWWLIVLISFAMWPVGMLLYFAYTRADDDKASAAALGGFSALGIMVLRLLLAMYNVSQPDTP